MSCSPEFALKKIFFKGLFTYLFILACGGSLLLLVGFL